MRSFRNDVNFSGQGCRCLLSLARHARLLRTFQQRLLRFQPKVVWTVHLKANVTLVQPSSASLISVKCLLGAQSRSLHAGTLPASEHLPRDTDVRRWRMRILLSGVQSECCVVWPSSCEYSTLSHLSIAFVRFRTLSQSVVCTF